ncbi:unnamed protein product [Caenorhabditis nigoni]
MHRWWLVPLPVPLVMSSSVIILTFSFSFFYSSPPSIIFRSPNPIRTGYQSKLYQKMMRSYESSEWNSDEP